MFIENSKEVSTLHLLHERSIISHKLSADSRQLGKKKSTILVKKDIATWLNFEVFVFISNGQVLDIHEKSIREGSSVRIANW